MLLCHFDIKRRRAICVILRAILTQSKSESFYSYGQNLKNLSCLWEINNKIPCFLCILCGINLYRIHVNLWFINDNLRLK